MYLFRWYIHIVDRVWGGLTSFGCGVLCARRPQERAQQHPRRQRAALHHHSREFSSPATRRALWHKRAPESTVYRLQRGGAHSHSDHYSQVRSIVPLSVASSPPPPSVSMVEPFGDARRWKLNFNQSGNSQPARAASGLQSCVCAARGTRAASTREVQAIPGENLPK